MLEQVSAIPTRTARDGWVRLWEASCGRPWRPGSRLARELLAAYRDFQRDWAATYGMLPAPDFRVTAAGPLARGPSLAAAVPLLHLRLLGDHGSERAAGTERAGRAG
ncbi:MAG: hypothetical protein IRZ14_14755 [Chloroflexi bacterium]|nr:hypothetical protein [Chloroflexota bacterium]